MVIEKKGLQGKIQNIIMTVLMLMMCGEKKWNSNCARKV